MKSTTPSGRKKRSIRFPRPPPRMPQMDQRWMRLKSSFLKYATNTRAMIISGRKEKSSLRVCCGRVEPRLNATALFLTWMSRMKSPNTGTMQPSVKSE